MELFRQNLAVEPDVQHFIRLSLTAISELGGNPFTASLALLEIGRRLRQAGAGTGYPLPVVLELHGQDVRIKCDTGHDIPLAKLREKPGQDQIKQISRKLQKSTEIIDPMLLLRRNQEMARYLDETRARTERELAELQASLDARQRELHETLRQAETDPLTGLCNRRAFDMRIGMAFRRAMRQHDEPLSLLLFDLDHFKEVNDQYGHQYGDAYLNKMAQAMLSVIRQDVDGAFRFGGDEFAMLLMADNATACDKARQVLRSMAGKVSVGIASIRADTPPSLTLEDFVRQADEALYQAKRAGRGRVICCPQNQLGCISECLIKAAAT
ncbi:MAG: GGDEF domain-containing protein [Pseudomonadota bacterium]